MSLFFASGVLAANTGVMIFDKEYDVDAAPYFAAGNGVQDDKAVIQSMFDDIETYSAANPSDVIGVHFGAGKTYRVASKLNLDSVNNVHFLGTAGNRPTISRHGNFNVSGAGTSQMWEMTNPNTVKIFDFIFDGRRDIVPRDGPFGHLIVVRGGSGFETYRSDYNRSQAVGLKIGPILAGQLPIETEDIPVDYICEDCLFEGNAKQGITVDYLYGGRFTRCVFEETGARHGDTAQAPSAGIDLEPLSTWGQNVTVGVDNILMDNCTMQQNDGAGVLITGTDGLVQNVEVKNSTFINNGKMPTGFGTFVGAVHVRNAPPTLHNIHFHDNVFRDQVTPPELGAGDPKWVFYVHGLENPSVLLEDNDFSGNTGASVLIGMRSLAEGTGQFTIRGNTIDISGGLSDLAEGNESQGPAAIAVQWSNVTVENNTITGNEPDAFDMAGVVVESTSNATPDDAVVQNNTINDLAIGLHLTFGTGLTTTPNTFNNCTVNVQDDR